MGKLRKKVKNRSNSAITADEVMSKSKATIDLNLKIREEKYDESNPLVLPAGHQKSKTKANKKEQIKVPDVKPLSKTQRKKLAKVLERKKKKLSRTELFEKLQLVQATSEEMELLTSTSIMQTSGLKRFSAESAAVKASEIPTRVSNIRGSKKKYFLPPRKKLKFDPSVVGLEDESSSESELEISEISKESVKENGNADFAEHIICPITNDQNEIEMNCNQKQELILQAHETECEVKDSVEKDITNKDHEPAIFVPVKRLPEIQASRECLPIFSEEQSIMEAIHENSIVVIHGETGTGKTTQVPQFLYEAGYTQNGKMIGITEPRRIAAVSMSLRVAKEMNLPNKVSYHIRYERNVGDETEIKFMTDGVLLKEIRQDFFLSKYSVIIIDEAHERSVFSDVLIGLLSRIVPLRKKKGDPLKLVIMSATIRVQDFTENSRLFKENPFLIRLESRQYKVQVHFNIRTPIDYIEAAYHKVCKIHNQLPPGAILVFLTGEKEVTKLCRMLRKTFRFEDKVLSSVDNSSDCVKLIKSIKRRRRKKSEEKTESFCDLPAKIDLDDYSVEPLDTESLQHQQSDDEGNLSENESSCKVSKPTESVQPLYILPLYSILPSKEQEKIFQPPPPGVRLCVVSTNVAETSITIPGLKYVVDSGKVKTKIYDKLAGGISSFAITWASKASANQRAGRAGRTEGGHCYRLYSSAVFEHEFPEFSPPEIQRIPVDDVLLQMKALGIDRVVSFPFPSPPDTEAMKAAEKRLVLLGALQDLQMGQRYKDIEKWEYSAKVTPLGQAMSRFPLSPRYAKMLLLSYKHNVIPHVIALVSAMTVPEVFLASTPDTDETDVNADGKPQWIGIKKIGAGTGKSLKLGDTMVLLRATALYEEAKNKVQFCIKNGIRHKAMLEVHKMRMQLTREMNRSFQDLSLQLNLKMDPPNDEEIDKLRKIVTTGFTDHIARKMPHERLEGGKTFKNAYECLDLDEPVFIHPSSILFSELPELVTYQEIAETSKYFMKGVTEIEPEWLPGFAPTLCCLSSPLEDSPPNYDDNKDIILCTMTAKFGRWQWDLPRVRMDMPRGSQKYSWFCFFLLDGQVCPFFKQYKKNLLSPPSTMLKSWAMSLPRSRTRFLLQAVISKEVDTREKLYKMWKTEKKFLLREFWEWLPEDKHLEVECKWPPQK